MGFSVSGATVVLFLGIFISFGMAYTAGNNGVEAIHAAYEDSTDDELDRQNTAVSIATASAANDDGDVTLNVAVENTGSTTLSVNDTDILIDGNYTRHTSDNMLTLEVDENDATDLWLSGETLRFEISLDYEPSRVKVVTGPGVSAAAEVSD
ncbi:fla cluster protein FlaF [Halorussus amylolyticus]|uniref:fla cluster protein FlaF n=1 Tax=Halorussus amylolyticus TaxID=1126242 RepID=UPI0010501527|nr:fla cluster protein FlaF [Halorussus amylolyticus]